MSERARTWTGLSLVLLSTTIYGVTPSLVTFSRGEMSTIDLIAYRSAIAALVFLGLARLGRARRDAGRDATRPRSLRGLGTSLLLWGPQVMLYYASFSYIDTSLAVAIGFSCPTIVVLLVAATRKRRPSSSDIGLSTLALVGIVCLLAPGSDAGVQPWGAVLAGLAALGYAAYVVLGDSLLQDADLFEVGWQVLAGAALSAMVVGLFLGELTLLRFPRELVVAGVQALLLVAATGCYYGGLTRLGSTQASPADSVQPAIALVAGAVLLGERTVAVHCWASR